MRLLFILLLLFIGCTKVKKIKSPEPQRHISAQITRLVIIEGVVKHYVRKHGVSTGVKVGDWEVDLANVPVDIEKLWGRKVRVFAVNVEDHGDIRGKFNFLSVVHIETID